MDHVHIMALSLFVNMKEIWNVLCLVDDQGWLVVILFLMPAELFEIANIVE